MTIWCHDCSRELEVRMSATDRDHNLIIHVAPCEHCLKAADLRGFHEGNADAYEDLADAKT